MAKIMLVEDDNNLREIYEARLQAEGYQIVSAKDGEEALALAVKEKPDLIISDVMMPKISGFDMLDILRSTPETKDTKVIMMTALSQAEDKARADKLGADRYLVKSQVTLEDVAKVARDVLEGKESAPTAGVGPVPATAAATPMPAADAPVTTSAADNTPPVMPGPASAPAAEPSAMPVAMPPSEPATTTPVMPQPAAPVEPTPPITPAVEPTVVPATPVEPPATSDPAASTPPATEPTTPPEPTMPPANDGPGAAPASAPTPDPMAPVDTSNVQTTDQEESKVEEQIEAFKQAPEPFAPTETVDPSNMASGSLLGSSGPTDSSASAASGGMVHEKVIQPLTLTADKPDIAQLAAQEDAKSGEETPPATNDQDSSTPGPDPNSVAL